jgi:hypothetical protein
MAQMALSLKHLNQPHALSICLFQLMETYNTCIMKPKQKSNHLDVIHAYDDTKTIHCSPVKYSDPYYPGKEQLALIRAKKRKKREPYNSSK